jgi:hypothetical protein
MPTFLTGILVLVLSGLASSLGARLSFPFYIPLVVVDTAAILILLRLAQLYYAPKRLKDEALKPAH